MILRNLIYIYQLEYYEKKRFLTFAYKHLNWFKLSQRDELKWTTRSALIYGLTLLLIIAILVSAFVVGTIWIALLAGFLAIIKLPLVIVLSDILIAPFVLLEKKIITTKAAHFIEEKKRGGLVTIGITGSFGKTTMKNVLVSVLEQQFKIVTFPGNVNTDVGIANYILSHQAAFETAKILICEMGAHRIGDISKLCAIVKPTHSILTAIGECHLERFGSFENIVTGKFELPNHTEKKAYLNTSNSNVKQYAGEKITHEVEVVKVHGKEDVKKIIHLNDFDGLSFELNDTVFRTKIVADYIIDFAAIALTLGRDLGMSSAKMKQGLESVDYIPHRLQIIKNKALNRVIIDDSYNGNYNGFLEGLKVLSRATGRKVVMSSGIVELGQKRSKVVHSELAKQYAKQVDLVLLIKNENTLFVVNEFEKLGYNNFKLYDSAAVAHSDLANVLKNGDTIIFQNDTSDNYA